MFFVYGTSGQLFRGSMEQLRQIGGVGALARAHGLQAVGRDGRDTSDPDHSVWPQVKPHPARGEDLRRSVPLAAYDQAQHSPNARRPLRVVSDVMAHDAITLVDTATVGQAWQLLAGQSVGQAPVVDARGQLVGLLSRAELLKPERLPTPQSHAVAWQALLAQNVKTIMWTPVPSVAPGSDIRRVARVLLDTGLPGLPVVDEQGLVSGFISRSDILRAVVTDPPLDLWG